MRTTDPRPAVRDEPAQDPLVQARRDPPPAPARRALELEVPSLPRVGQNRLLERPQAASRQRPRVDLLLRLARRGERRVGPQCALLPHAAPLRSSRTPKASSSGSTGNGTCHIAPHEGHSKESSELRALRRQQAGRSTSWRTSSPRGAIQVRGTTRPSRRGG